MENLEAHAVSREKASVNFASFMLDARRYGHNRCARAFSDSGTSSRIHFTMIQYPDLAGGTQLARGALGLAHA